MSPAAEFGAQAYAVAQLALALDEVEPLLADREAPWNWVAGLHILERMEQSLEQSAEATARAIEGKMLDHVLSEDAVEGAGRQREGASGVETDGGPALGMQIGVEPSGQARAAGSQMKLVRSRVTQVAAHEWRGAPVQGKGTARMIDALNQPSDSGHAEKAGGSGRGIHVVVSARSFASMTAVSTGNGQAGGDARSAQVAAATCSAVISFMQRRLKSQEFQRQQGAQGTGEKRFRLAL